MLYPNQCYNEECYKRNALYLLSIYILMDFPKHIDTIRMGLSILYILRGHMMEFKNSGAFIDLKIVLPLQTVQNLMENHILWQSIWVFTVCPSTFLGIFSIQTRKKQRNICRI